MIAVQDICREFGNGAAANRNEQPRAANPHMPSDALYDAWNAGWDEEEGPAFVLTARAVRDYGHVTLAAVWPGVAA